MSGANNLRYRPLRGREGNPFGHALVRRPNPHRNSGKARLANYFAALSDDRLIDSRGVCERSVLLFSIRRQQEEGATWLNERMYESV